MVILTSRVALIAASLSLAAISNAPTAEGVAVPANRASEVTARHAPPREDAPLLHLPESAKAKVTLESNHRKGKTSRSLTSRDVKVHLMQHQPEDGSDPLIRVTLGDGDGIHLKRSGEQRFFHVRRSPTPFPDHEHGHRQHPGHHRRRSSLTRRAPPRRARPHPRSFMVAREPQVQGVPGQISLEDQEGKAYGWLVYNPSNKDVDASDKGTVWDLVPEPCPQDCEFEHCASFAIVDPSDINKSRCITYSTSSSQPQSLHGYHCFEKDRPSNEDEPTVHRSQIFGYDPATGVVQAIPMNDASSSTQPSRSVQRRQHGKLVTLVFHPYDESTRASSVDESDALSSDEDLEDSNSTSTLSSGSSTASTSTVIATSTTTLTVTVAADSASATSSSSNSVASSPSLTSRTTATTAVHTANALKVEVFSAPSSADSVVSSPSSSATTSVEASTSATVTPTTSVDGDVIASSVAAEYSSSYSSSSLASVTTDSTSVATNTDTTTSTTTDATATTTSTAAARK
ncbi:hypothetical protein AAF712_013884 [Marasmius tenuissimus]|uniref:Uncharacterized protein n=1 Tax=Marasmius tenuissimus TaxID=585030 RepID=A0ABR2ZF12_9AGAR